MMTKIETSDLSVELKKLLAAKKLLFGAEETVKALRKGGVQKVYIVATCNDVVRSDVETLCKVSGVELVTLSQSSDEIGVICKKPFGVSVISVI